MRLFGIRTMLELPWKRRNVLSVAFWPTSSAITAVKSHGSNDLLMLLVYGTMRNVCGIR